VDSGFADASQWFVTEIPQMVVILGYDDELPDGAAWLSRAA
jgi:hypothetical protein